MNKPDSGDYHMIYKINELIDNFNEFKEEVQHIKDTLCDLLVFLDGFAEGAELVDLADAFKVFKEQLDKKEVKEDATVPDPMSTGRQSKSKNLSYWRKPWLKGDPM